MKSVVSLILNLILFCTLTVSTSFASQADAYLTMLDAPSIQTRLQAAKLVYNDKYFEEQILKKVEKNLLLGYSLNSRRKLHFEEMAFYCKILGASGNLEYGRLLRQIESSARNGKIKRHATNARKLLADNAELNKLASSKEGWNSSLSDDENRQLQLLRSEQFRLKRTAGKQIFRSPGANEILYDEIAKQLIASTNEDSSDRDYVDSMAWLCKALGSSGKTKYKETLQKVKEQTSNRKLKKYADQSLKLL